MHGKKFHTKKVLFMYIKELHTSRSPIRKEIYTQKELRIKRLNFKKDLCIKESN